MKKLKAVMLLLVICSILVSCGCEHSFDTGTIITAPTCTAAGKIEYKCTLCGKSETEAIPVTGHTYTSKTVKEAAYKVEGLVEYTCSMCGDTYTETVPPTDDEVIVTVTDKTNITKNIDNGRYSDRVEFTFKIENVTDQSIQGVQGILTVRDLFGTEILSINCDFTGEIIPQNGTVTRSGLGIDINEYIDSDTKLYNENFADLQFEYTVTQVVFGTGQKQVSDNSGQSVSRKEADITVIDKTNLEENWDADRFSPQVEFTFVIRNNTEKAIRGIQGVLIIKDMFGCDILSLNCDFTGNTIEPDCSITVGGLSLEINEFMDEHVKLYNEKFEDLIFEYNITDIVYSD